MKSVLFALTLSVGLSACSDFPRDTDGTLQQIRQDKTFRVGLIAGSPDEEGRGRRLVEAVAAETGASPRIHSGAAEPLLTDLEEGRLDLVVGTMAAKSPWSRKVHASKPLQPGSEKAPVSLVALARNGENAWISLLHRQVEQVRGQP